MKPFFVAVVSMFTMFQLSLQHIPMILNVIIQTTIGILTIIYLIKKLKQLK